jgi:antitoxin VapB
MSGTDKQESDKRAWTRGVGRVFGSAPWMKPNDKQRLRAKLFKSGNSLAVRIPAGTLLKPGMEVDMTIEHGMFVSLEPVDAPKRKFNIAKVAGSATNLAYIADEDRLFEERALDWPTQNDTADR